MRFDGKVAVITGAARGMGFSHCLSFAKEGADIAAVDICDNIEGIYELSSDLNNVVNEIKKLGRKAIGIKCDVRKADEVQNMVNEVVKEFGSIDILVNNAGIEAFNYTWDIPIEEWDKVLDVDLKGVFLCCKYVAPIMIEKKSGKIVNISSIYGSQAAPMVSHYCAAKFGVVGFTQSLSQELAAYNINVNAVGPGFVNTSMADAEAPVFAPLMGLSPESYYEEAVKQVSLFAREITPQDISNAVVWLSSEESRNVTGQFILVDGGHV
ncbi:SDR family NAD(P)-dependent oxidoreductase [Thermodesulfobacteriota bacterium]